MTEPSGRSGTLERVREAAALLARNGAGGLVSVQELLGRPFAGGGGGGSGPGGAMEVWRTAERFLGEIEPWGMAGPAALAVRLGSPVEEAVSVVPAEIYMARADVPRLRLRLAARGHAVASQGRTVLFGDASLVLRGRILPPAFGAVPVLPFARRTADVRGVRLVEPQAARMAALLRAGAEMLADTPLWPWHLVEAAVLRRTVRREGEDPWPALLARWGLDRFAEAVGSLVATDGDPAPEALAMVPGFSSPEQRRNAVRELIGGRLRRLRFTLATRNGPRGEEWT